MPKEPTSLTVELLKQFVPFQSISEDNLLLLAGTLQVRTAATNTCLFEVGDIDSNEYFLLLGKVKLTAEDGVSRFIEASQETAKHPIARLRPRQYKVTAASYIEYFMVDSDLLEELRSSDSAAEGDLISYAVDEVELGGELDERRLMESFDSDLASNKFVLTSLPEVAIKVRNVLEDVSVNAEQIARIVNLDPAIAAKLIRAANSSIYRGASQCDSTKAAIVRLGVNTTKQLALSFTLREVFNSKSPLLKKKMQQRWSHCVDVAAISFVLAKHVSGFSPEEAMLGGLLHDIGVLSILNYAKNYDALLANEELLDQVIDKLKSEVGAMVLEEWSFQKKFIDIARESGDWMRMGNPEPDYCDLIIVAKLHSYIGKRGAPPHPRMDQVPAFKKLSVSKLTPQLALQILEEAKDQISEARGLLLAA